MRHGLSIVISRVIEVVPMEGDDAQDMFKATNGEELTAAGDAFVAAITRRVRDLEKALGESEARCEQMSSQLEENVEEVTRACDQAYLLACLLAYLLTCLLTYLPTCLLTF